MKLSIIIPIYNEENTIATTIKKVLNAPVPFGITKEIIAVNDGSKDKSAEIINGLANDTVRVFHLDKNQGKGAALRLGFSQASGDFIVIQDADLEYNPEEYSNLLNPILNGHADVVFGSRFISTGPHRVIYFWH